MKRSCSRFRGLMQAGMGLAVSAFGQSLVEPERIPAVREFFATAASAPPLRCEINPVRPSLNFAFRFQAGYTVDIPFAQFHGSGHDLTVYARVTPEGREPVYMMKTEALPDSPATDIDAATGGAFVVGEGTYGLEDPVEVLMRLRDQVVERGERIPNHTCVEAIERDRYEPVTGRAPKSCDTLLARRKQADFQKRLKLSSTDWLRLDVAYAGGSEIYSWAGARKFEEGELEDLVPEGATGTGPFATMLLAIFEPRFPRSEERRVGKESGSR